MAFSKTMHALSTNNGFAIAFYETRVKNHLF